MNGDLCTIGQDQCVFGSHAMQGQNCIRFESLVRLACHQHVFWNATSGIASTVHTPLHYHFYVRCTLTITTATAIANAISFVPIAIPVDVAHAVAIVLSSKDDGRQRHNTAAVITTSEVNFMLVSQDDVLFCFVLFRMLLELKL